MVDYGVGTDDIETSKKTYYYGYIKDCETVAGGIRYRVENWRKDHAETK